MENHTDMNTDILVGLNEVQMDLGLKGDHEACDKVRAIKQLVLEMTAGVPQIVTGYRNNALAQCEALLGLLRDSGRGQVNDNELFIIQLAAEQTARCLNMYFARKQTTEQGGTVG